MQISNNSLEQAVLALLCFSNEQAPVIALRLHDHTLFTNETSKKLAEVALEYIRKYSTAPNGQLELILENELRRGELGKLLSQEIVLLQRQVSQLNPQFIIEQLDHFLETQQLHKSLSESIELLERGDLAEAREHLYKQAVLPVSDRPGIWLHDPKQSLSFLDAHEETDFFSSGIPLLDARGTRPERKTLMFMIASTGKGKTFWLIEVGKAALQYHKKVLHVTLELSQEKTSKRYIQSIFSLTRQETEQIRVPYFNRDAAGSVTIDFREFTRESVIAKRREIYQSLLHMTSMKLLIKEYPPQSLTTQHLVLYLDSLEREYKFKPDILILDYADLMYIDAESLRIDTGRLYRELRGLAVSRNIALVTASQSNREGDDAKLVGRKNVAEDWSKIATSDVCITFSQTPQELKLGLARIFVTKSRDVGDQYIALISQNYHISQFCLDSVSMNPEIINQINQLNPTGSS